jgi:A/G-specific adenine glycosylase
VVAPARAAALRRRLTAWWARGRRSLPWRVPQREADPYRVWLAEVMLQQTRVEVVVPYYQRFLARWPTLAALAAAEDAEVLAAWSGLGYYARCRNLLLAARAALARHGGLPASLEALSALPGLGPYTAGAVASIAFALPAAAVDGNVARVLSRLFRVEGEAASGAVRERLWALARALVGAPVAGGRGRAGPQDPGDWNQALMELGATVCTRAPACGRCPLAPLCEARAAGLERAIPRPRRRPARRELALACALVERGGELLLQRQPPGGLFGGLLAPPWAEASPGQDPEALLRGALGALGLRVRPGSDAGGVRRTLTHRELVLRAHRCALLGEEGARPPGLEWIPWGKLERAGLPAAVRALLAEVGAASPGRPGRRPGPPEERNRGGARLLRAVDVEGRPAHTSKVGGRRVPRRNHEAP